MKKLVALMLVFGMASMASATLRISVGGDPNPVDTEIWLMPSETIELDIWTDAVISPGVGEGYFAILCDPAGGNITGGANAFPAEPSIIPAPYPIPPMVGTWAGITLATAPSVPVDQVIVNGIIFHCDSEQDVLIQLIYDPYSIPVYGAAQVVDSVIIHQIPEPATMALLSLGGLFLLRRRK